MPICALPEMPQFLPPRTVIGKCGPKSGLLPSFSVAGCTLWPKNGNTVGSFAAGDGLNDISDTMERIRNLLPESVRYTGHHEFVPQKRCVAHALEWLPDFRRAVGSGGNIWLPPHVTASPEGEVVFEWWNSGKCLTVYIEPDSVYHVRVWGDSFQDDMADGELARGEWNSVWRWLQG